MRKHLSQIGLKLLLELFAIKTKLTLIAVIFEPLIFFCIRLNTLVKVTQVHIVLNCIDIAWSMSILGYSTS